jgi:hypothetical protein
LKALILTTCVAFVLLSCSDSLSQKGGPFRYGSIQKTEPLPEGFIVDHGYDPDRAFGYLPPGVIAPGFQEKDREEIDYEGYHRYEQLVEELTSLASSPIMELKSAGQSVEGRELWYVVVSDRPNMDEHEPNLLFIANMHGDEVVGRELMVYLLRLFADQYDTDPQITNLVNNNKIFIMPTMNPDGFENGSRFNGHNVDLNRDFPDFTSDPLDSGEGREPETIAIMNLHDQHHFLAALNFHGGEVCVNMPWDTQSNGTDQTRFGDHTFMTALSRDYADRNPTMVANDRGPMDRGITFGYEWYHIDGGLQDFANYYRRSFHATVELSYRKWPTADSLQEYWQENQRSFLGFLKSASMGVHLQVVDSQGEAVANFSVEVSESLRAIPYSVEQEGGYGHRLTLPGDIQVRVKSPGYVSASLVLAARSFDGSFERVVLLRD